MGIRVTVSLISLVIGMIVVKQKIKKEKNFIGIILISIYVSASILVMPMFVENNMFFNTINILSYTLQACFFNADIPSIQNEIIGDIFVQGLLSTELFLLPILTAGTVFEILQVYFGKIKIAFMLNKDIHIFSEINEKSINIAKLVKKDYPKDKIIFCNSKKENEIDEFSSKGYVLIKEDIKNLKINFGKNKIRFYILSKDEEKVLETTIKLIEKYKNSNCEILSFIGNDESKMILDEIDKGKITLNIVDELQNSIYHLLIDKPLFKNAKNEKIKVLIIGLENVGREVFKSILWCGQMPKYTLEINAVEKDEEQIKELMFDCPEVFKNKNEYNFSYYIEDIKNLDNNKELQEKIKDSTYVIVSTGNEEDNVKISRNLKSFFVKNNNEPEIFAYMVESIKKDKIRQLENPFIFNTFGDYKETYDFIEKNSELEKIAIDLHLSYMPNDTDLVEYNKREYNKKSSRATALHLIYKLAPYIKNMDDKDIINSEIEKIINDKDIILEIAKVEHKRWIAYLRTEGYELASSDTLKRYYSKSGKIKEHFLKLHPGLKAWEELDDVSKIIAEVEKTTEKDFKESTINSVVEILKNIGKEIKNV